MRRLFLAVVICALAGAGGAFALVARQAPNVSWIDSTGRAQNLAKFKGQPVVLLIAPSPRDRTFRSQVGQIQKMYERYGADRTVFVVAFTREPGVIRSNIPFAIAADGPRVAHDYEAGKFAIAIIGRDGNLDYVTGKVLPAQRIFDVIGNSFVPQEKLRRP